MYTQLEVNRLTPSLSGYWFREMISCDFKLSFAVDVCIQMQITENLLQNLKEGSSILSF